MIMIKVTACMSQCFPPGGGVLSLKFSVHIYKQNFKKIPLLQWHSYNTLNNLVKNVSKQYMFSIMGNKFIGCLLGPFV